MKGALTTGAYQARSVIAANQRCVNLYAEQNPADSEFPVTHYPTPGLIRRAIAPTRGFRGLYGASNGELFAAVASKLYAVSADWVFTELGTLLSVAGPVSMRDNSAELVVVDGSKFGYRVDLSSHEFSIIDDEAFYGSNRVAVIDDFMLFNQPGTRQFYASGALAVTFDPLDIAAKNGASDKTVAVEVANRTIWVFGEKTTEVWYNAGASDFAFARYPGTFIEYGCASPASIAAMDTSVYWLGGGEKGEGLVFRSDQMSALMISTPALSDELRTYPRLDDAIGYTHQADGHMFYVLTFPSADKTWCYDLSTKQWHERLWMDDAGKLHRHRGACFATWRGMQLVGDWENGNLYEMSLETFDDDGEERLHVRSWPNTGNDGDVITYDRFIVDMEVGTVGANDPEPQVRLRWSDTRGRTWGTPLSRGLGERGEFGRRAQFNRLGCDRGMGRIFEVSWSTKVKTALNGAYIKASGEA
ncbi:hypothetical protein [Burkholderia territorii]|uniref:hypothetical protein n=1 Tax=Burkholderia territorii TaxID=1503055 RepID=UPI00075D5906|nr:hypothetical protein [Burkholderia territorii]KUZ35275.1 hypothetical protein WS52_04755 [Burkholderia territorii]KUZ46442.1 hypothetical protein WS53_27425 [Burkholderia territorii]